MPTPKKSPGQGRDFYVAELYQAAMELDISDGAHRVLCALIRRINTDPATKAYETTFVGQEWIAMHINKDVRGVRRFVAELVTAGLIQVAQSGRNDTNLTRVDVDNLLRLGRAHSEDTDAKLTELRAARKADKEEDLRSKLDKSGRIKSPSRDGQESPGHGRSKAPSDLISISNQKITTSTAPTSSATQPPVVASVVGGSRAHDDPTTITNASPPTLTPQNDRGFTQDEVDHGDYYVEEIVTELDRLLANGQIMQDRLTLIKSGLAHRRYTIGRELIHAYAGGFTDTHERQVVNDWIKKIVLRREQRPEAYAATLIAFVRGRVEVIVRSTEARVH
jgi:hypothetical protein